jgi:hypothetical protein
MLAFREGRNRQVRDLPHGSQHNETLARHGRDVIVKQTIMKFDPV